MTSRTIANHLLNIKAVTLSPAKPYTWSSGLKSPIYCDNRLTLSYPHIRNEIAEGLVAMIREAAPDADIIAGTATAGIPHAAFVAEKLQLPMIYVRSSAKGHGKQNAIEGHLPSGSKVVVIEDLISTGGSSIAAAEALRAAGAEVLLVAAIFSYQLSQSDENFNGAKLPVRVLTTYATLVEEAQKRGAITSEEQAKLEAWRKNPKDEAWMNL
ncbi:orotate phosphoribosyltransferase [Shouchella clausii]|nr:MULTISPECIES: orotate phosphoribosyltransferase [Shouchella]MCM3312258.1 orotate phosphoribosyltransferase [Psychrobacillus sp. MER TA 17]KKI87773.1 orotate phosphoribosyltransferase [Shouchella clausii]MBU3230757.1 orotate phosphoribosyltransferase [Shouchella clausii]MBU3263168.1 orotate phosphoribosyltransferase [Shouchella clausii]MBU3505633.1 orotate phosphoribosyltransferase [Shouchella clausii]